MFAFPVNKNIETNLRTIHIFLGKALNINFALYDLQQQQLVQIL